MSYPSRIVFARWQQRLNRFAGQVWLDDHVERIHIQNTGRLRELLVPGAQVALMARTGAHRRTRYSLVAVHTGKVWVNVDSHMPNQVTAEALAAAAMPEWPPLQVLRQEVRFAQSRFDFYYEADGFRGFIEVKGVTLVEDGVAMFPDAPTARGSKHMEELAKAVRSGYAGWVIFVIQRSDAHAFRPNQAQDPVFAEALYRAVAQGVQVCAFNCLVNPDRVTWNAFVPVYF
ncbi:DNA/RNA nuclease SfsA [Alicyclobacillus cellulosilyticus]|uniref:DNA/RNA nuclease SfsA n=1 Tax=Alicyclobacillus cellulosilyticus TaxID=1003997 RepID=UPI001662EC58|nr:DNA/RNA nuclease SfsA [Alicyclobacillus cellulosilyticus]